MPPGFDPLVVDNGSTDGSGDVARDLGARVVVEPQRGFGAACWAGLVAAPHDLVCFMDADASLDPADLPIVAGPVADGRADLVVAARRPEPGAWPWPARTANRVLAARTSRRLGFRLHDVGPMRAVRRDGLLALGIRDRRSGWPLEMVVRAARAGWRVDEVAVPYRPRVGRSKVTGTFRGTVQAVVDMGRVLRAADRNGGLA
jgi:dTDP-L-rhamnose 4-epimerase